MYNFPQLKKNQVAILAAATATGHIVDINFNTVTSNDSKIYRVFESLDDALFYIKSFLEKRSDIEFLIYDFKKTLLKFVNPT